MIEQVKRAGFKVYMRKPTDTYLYFTDGSRIGYLQTERGVYSLSSVHVPNSEAGTGFGIDDCMGTIDRASLERAFVIAPHWHRGETPAKWKNWEAFQNANQWNKGFIEQ